MRLWLKSAIDWELLWENFLCFSQVFFSPLLSFAVRALFYAEDGRALAQALIHMWGEMMRHKKPSEDATHWSPFFHVRYERKVLSGFVSFPAQHPKDRMHATCTLHFSHKKKSKRNLRVLIRTACCSVLFLYSEMEVSVFYLLQIFCVIYWLLHSSLGCESISAAAEWELSIFML